MKRVYLILTLFMTSFFLLSSTVSADIITYEVKEEDMEYIRSNEFKLLREKIIEYCNENNLSYITFANNSGVLESYVFNTTASISLSFKSTDRYSFLLPYSSSKKYKIVDNILTESGTHSGATLYLINNDLSYSKFLDTNIVSHNYISNVEFIIKYNDLSYNIVENSRVPTLYEVYLDYEKPIEEPEEKDPKAEIVTNFYVLITDKIKLLSSYIATDYIILSALVIFIFVAVIGLVRRL